MMTEKFLNKYRVPSARMQTWDYASHAAYYITICTAGHHPYLGDIARVPAAGESTNPGTANVETPCMASLPPDQSCPVYAETPCMASLPPKQPGEIPVVITTPRKPEPPSKPTP